MRNLSLRAKFFWLALSNVMILVLLLVLFVRHQLGRDFQSFLMATAREKIVAVAGQISVDLSTAKRTQYDEILAQYSRLYGIPFRLYDSEGSLLGGPAIAVPEPVRDRLVRTPLAGVRRLPEGAAIPTPPPFLVEAGEPRQYWIGVRTLMPGPDGPHSSRATLILTTSTLLRNSFFFDWDPWLAILATAVAVTLLCWLPLVRGLTRDISKMTAATAELAEGRFDVQVDARRGDELGVLGRAINQMAARLRDYVHGQKRFLGDAAHELRSPLGRMQVALSILDRKVEPESAKYVQDLQEDVEFLSGLTTELLTFARSEMKQEPVKRVPVRLLPLAERVAQMEAAGADLQIAIDSKLAALGDEALLFRAVSNLVRNAVKYAGTEERIEIAAAAHDGRVTLTVSDHGPGIPEAALDNIFAPFFRLDTARERKTGGVGLGLAIVRSAVEACGGSVHAENRTEGGLRVVVKLDAAAPAS